MSAQTGVVKTGDTACTQQNQMDFKRNLYCRLFITLKMLRALVWEGCAWIIFFFFLDLELQREMCVRMRSVNFVSGDYLFLVVSYLEFYSFSYQD